MGEWFLYHQLSFEKQDKCKKNILLTEQFARQPPESMMHDLEIYEELIIDLPKFKVAMKPV